MWSSRKKPPDDGGLLLDTKDRRLKKECTLAPKKHHNRHLNACNSLRRSINAASPRAQAKMGRLAEKGGGEPEVHAWLVNGNSPQRSRILMPICMGRVVLWSYIDKQICSIYAYGGGCLKEITNGEAFKYWSLTAAIDNDQSFCEGQPTTSKCLVFSVDSDEDVIEKPPGLNRQLILWGVFFTIHGELLEGTIDFALLPEYFGGSSDRDYAEKLVVEAFDQSL
ncbi:hypothetical protein THAOC_12124 [Thalassiosira oceanica]|uniref:Uncharacterized protein n=1 Tax=Thalassiosira oceanica TaxID=159749 RepID=K0SNF4_THAOC|nr:hypothetical protein THAOC_12124 [Thalassiosira oceanica]|eukprot:EJK66905.1 hypothetical protein THAOC_12124 [Thalassiosira oceanica]